MSILLSAAWRRDGYDDLVARCSFKRPNGLRYDFDKFLEVALAMGFLAGERHSSIGSLLPIGVCCMCESRVKVSLVT